MYRLTACLRKNLPCLACRYYPSCMTSGRVRGPEPKVRQMRVERFGEMEQASPICSRAYGKDVMHARYRKCLLAACSKQAEPGMAPSSGVHEA
jgi:hypothetical protein